MTTPKELSSMLSHDVLGVVQTLLPAGKQKGHEYEVGSVGGEAGKSLRVRLDGDKAGVWSDFSTGESGDLLDLWRQVRGLSFVETLKEVKSHLGVDERPKFKAKKYRKPDKPKCQEPDQRLYDWWRRCGIARETVDRLKVVQQGSAIVFPYLSPEGELELVKYRDMYQKKFWSNSEPIPCLFGWQAVGKDDRDIVICEGEKDCLTFWQQGIPALSVPRGAGGGDWIEYEFLRLERFDEVYIAMDSDEAGRDAVAEIIDRLGRHRCKVVSFDYVGNIYKDPNEAHLDGIDLNIFLRNARTLDPEELKRLSDFHDDIMSELDPLKKQNAGLKLPWRKSFDLVRLRKSEVTVWAGINSHGKSVLLSHVMVNAVAQGSKWCVASMEMPAAKLGAKVYQQAGTVENPSREYGQAIKQLIDENVYLFTAYGTAKASKILSVFEYARKRYGVTHVVIDSLAKCGFAEDDFNSQKDFVDKLFDYALETGVHVHLVVHMRKGETEEKPPNKMDVKGSGSITDMVSNVFIIWRNKLKEKLLLSNNPCDVEKAKDMADTLLRCVKQRETGEEPTFSLWFHKKSCQFLEAPTDEPKRYVP